MKYAVKALLSHEVDRGSTVTVSGWVRTRRDSKAGLSFLAVYDGSCFNPIQVIISNDLSNYSTEVLHLNVGCSVEVTGSLNASKGKGQSVEIHSHCIRVIGWVDQPETYPISPKYHRLEYLRNVAHLRPRTNVIGAMTRVRHRLSQAIHRYFDERRFYWITTPLITSSDCEGASDLFRVSTLDLMNIPRTDTGAVDFGQDFFGRETFLTVSGQLNVESYCLAMSNVYTFGPTFRSEDSNTSRHLAEFWMVEPEIAFSNLQDDIHLADGLLKYVVNAALSECEEDLKFFNQHIDSNCIERLEHFIASSLAVLTYTESVNILKNANQSFEFPIEWGLDLQAEHERYLSEEHCQGPLVVTDYPKDIKGFYMRLNSDQKTVSAMDILVPGIGEIVGGSQREERLDVLDQRIDELKMDKNQYQWYRDLRRYGSVPHAGFGLGFERLLGYVTGLSNIRDLIPFPRTPGHAEY